IPKIPAPPAKNGELCLFSVQCKSSCCQRSSGIDLFRCAPRGTLYGTYYFCPCEKGRDCKGDWSIGGFITSTNFGTCVDPN
uniref:Colipase C-terminal domain-containing protein n=1 Tax=Pygocentrus nattereri TaxID=42514 RepID=A0A3B4CM74_PYGNA